MRHNSMRTIGGIGRSMDVDAAGAAPDFDDFYRTHQPRLMGALTLYTGDRELAMDLAQEALARAYRDWRKVSDLDTPSLWLFRVGFNLAKSTFRRKMAEWRASRRWHARQEVVQHDTDTSGTVAVRAAVSSLPTRQRTALVLRYYADLSVDDAAAQMGCAPGTVRALTSQAVAALRGAGLVESVEVIE